jgi:hypothetical protein
MTPFVPVEDLKRVTKGSHQEVILALVEALQTRLSEFGNKPVHLLSTFKDHVVVLSEANNTVMKVAYSFDVEGRVHFTKHTPLNVPVVTESNLRTYVRNEAKAAAGLFLSGYTARANAKIEAIAGLVDSEAFLDDDAIVNGFLEARENPRQWKQFIAEKKDTLLEGVLRGVELPAPLKPKFVKLYDGATAKEELPAFKGLVHSDISTAIKRLNAVEEQVGAALTQIRTIKAGSAQLSAHPAGLALENTTSDLLDDVRSVRDFLLEATEQFAQVDLVAKVFDSVAAEVATFEVAGAFAAKMATRLAEATR